LALATIAAAGSAATGVAGALGSRAITSLPPVVLTSAAGVPTVNGSVSIGVTETAASGANPWTLTMAITTLTRSGGTDTVTSGNIQVAGRSTTATGGGGTITNPSGAQDLSATRTLVTNTQNPVTIYNGVYTTTATLAMSVPNGSHVGAYTGTLTITLIQ
jgi:hypothetical protein